MSDLAPLPLRAGAMPLATLIELYFREYKGRDSTRVTRLTWWRDRFGAVALQDLDDDRVHSALEDLASRPARVYAGRDEAGRPVYQYKKQLMAAATVNRYAAALSAVLSFAVKRRIAPKGWVHPCRSIERRTERNERTRFLSDDECRRLLEACRASNWPRLYALVLAALTTGARKGELLGLRWEDVDLEQAIAHVRRTKNGDERKLPLVPALVDELRRFEGSAAALVFGSSRDPSRPFNFEPRWHEALRVAKIKGVVLHTCRHTFASILAQNGATLVELMDAMGHRQMQMVRRYAHISTGHKAALVNRVMGQVFGAGQPNQGGQS